MIISKLIGGLGNQMFQYALGRNLALVNNTDLVLDISGFSQFPERNYGLHHFKIDASIAGESTLRKIDLIKRPDKTLIQKISTKSYRYLKQDDFDYYFRNDIVGKYNKHLYVDGYWQSEKYFLSIKDVIKREFSLEHLAANLDRNVLDSIVRKNSVSVHVRRGDYVSHDISNEFHGLCGLTYYIDAFNYILANTPDPYFFIFSDDIAWCRENLVFLEHVSFVENDNPLSAYKDLYLMTKCKHHIIANSSFSWWGAWLGVNEENKIVVAPDNWFNKESKWYKEHSISTKDIVPGNWMRI